MEIDNVKCLLQEHHSAKAPTFERKMYNQELIVRAFQYFGISRRLYYRPRTDY